MQDATDLPNKQKKPEVRVFASDGDEQQYRQIGDGQLQIVTDIIMPLPQHYIQVTEPKTGELILRSRLFKMNHYERKKMTVIYWTDPEQAESPDLALSFLDQDDCDMYWKLICSKIGKNYLEINGNQKLQLPNQKNIDHILNKAKNSYNLLAFHVINSKQFMDSLWQISQKFKLEKNKSGMATVMKILKQILSHYDPTIMIILINNSNFMSLLEAFQCNSLINLEFKGIPLIKMFKKMSKFHKIVEMSQELQEKIQISIRARFLKEINDNQYLKIQKMPTMIENVLKQTHVNILSLLLSENTVDKVIQLFRTSNKNPEIKNNSKDYINIMHQITHFFREVFHLLWSISSFNIKKAMLQQLKSEKILQLISDIINQGYYKMIEVVSYLAKEDPQFFTVFKENFRKNSQKSLNRVISKQFSNNIHFGVVFETIDFLEQIISDLNTSRENYEFFNSTFIVVVFGSCKQYERIIILASFLAQKLEKFSRMFSQIIRSDILTKMIRQYNQKEPENERRENQMHDQTIRLPDKGTYHKNIQSKKMVYRFSKIVKAVLLSSTFESGHLSHVDNDAIEQSNRNLQYIAQSGVLQFCLDHLHNNMHKNNLTTSCVLQILSILSLIRYNPCTKIVQNFVFQTRKINSNSFRIISNHLKNINKKSQEDRRRTTDQQSQDIFGQAYDQLRKKNHKSLLQEEEEQKYILGEDENQDNSKGQKNKEKQLKNNMSQQFRAEQNYINQLMKKKQESIEQEKQRQLEQKRKREELESNLMKKKQKEQKQAPEFQIQFNFDLPEEDEGNKNQQEQKKQEKQ